MGSQNRVIKLYFLSQWVEWFSTDTVFRFDLNSILQISERTLIIRSSKWCIYDQKWRYPKVLVFFCKHLMKYLKIFSPRNTLCITQIFCINHFLKDFYLNSYHMSGELSSGTMTVTISSIVYMYHIGRPSHISVKCPLSNCIFQNMTRLSINAQPQHDINSTCALMWWVYGPQTYWNI